MKLRQTFWKFGLVPALILLTVLANACSAPTPSQQQEDSAVNEAVTTEAVLARAMTSEPASLDPHGPASSGLSLALPYLFDTLVTRDVDNTIVPLLAESWETAEDGKAITFTLKSNVIFHDGTPLDAEAVKFSFDRFKEIGARSPIYAGINQIDSVEAVDNTTAVFRFAEPTATIWSTLSMPYAAVVSPDSIAAMEQTGEGYPIGTGPFLLEEWQSGQSLTLRRNADYNWGPPTMDNTSAPYLDAMVFKIIPDAATQIAALEAGDVDVVFINQPSHKAKLEQDADIEMHETILNSLIYLGFNNQKSPFDDPVVRRALSHAVDKQQIVDLALGGLGMAAFAPLPPTLPGFDPSLQEYEADFNPQEAKRLLQDAGFEQTNDGGWQRDDETLSVKLITSARSPNGDVATVLQSQLQAIGVPVEIEQLDAKAVMDATGSGDYDLLLWRYDWNDPDALNIFLSTDRIGSTDRVAYSNPEVDELLRQGALEIDQQERLKYYIEAQKLILQDAPWQPLYNPIDAIAVAKRIQGVEAGYMGRLLVNDAQVVEHQPSQ